VTIRADQHPVRIGHFSSVGDGSNMHTAHALPAGISASINIGKNVTIESNCVIHSSIIDDDVVIGRGSVIL
jgi:carbonic anhydrase/acetyltransferase-like protein (isoleucine patch superfamily)